MGCITLFIFIMTLLTLPVPSSQLIIHPNQKPTTTSTPRVIVPQPANIRTRRRFLLTAATLPLSFPPLPSLAATELGSKLNALVTKSNLGLSVRRDVVASAQFMDKIDGDWERFSDRNGLGSNRRRQNKRQPFSEMEPPPPLKELDGRYLARLLEVRT